VASIGNEQNILYRVSGTGSLQGDRPTCLSRADGTRIRCGTLADQDGNGIGTRFGPGTAGGNPNAVPASDLSTLTNAQLIDLINRAQQGAARRLTAQWPCF
jgi:hypothetical protein